MHTRKNLATVLILLFFSIYAVPTQGQSDPLAELEAWNQIKESSVAADYHAFLKKFPYGSLAARARERMNALGDPVWNLLKKSNDPFKYRDYIKANPDSPFIDQAKARLEVLAPAAIEWEKVKAAGDRTAVMEFIRNKPSHPFVDDAKAEIENSLWTEAVRTGELRLLEFYALHYAGTERGKEAAEKVKSLRATKREQEFQAIRSNIAALNGVQVNRQPVRGTSGATMWYENKIIDICTVETTASEMLTLNPMMYSSETYRIDLATVGPISTGSSFPGTTSVFANFGGRRFFSGTGKNYSRKSVAKPFTLLSSYVVTSSFATTLTTHDSSVAAKFAADLNSLATICRSTK